MTTGNDLLYRIESYKNRVRNFYYAVMLSGHCCPNCCGRLQMTGQSQAKCESCGHLLDPTRVFQHSSCCGAGLMRRHVHYVCSRCHKIVPSRFLFDERIYDSAYFREMMQASRQRAKKRQEEIGRLMVQARSGGLYLLEEPILEDVPGLIDDLDEFVQTDEELIYGYKWEQEQPFTILEYKNHIFDLLGWGKTLFSSIAPLQENGRQDRIYRFISLIFMQHDGEIELTQYEDDIWIRRIYHEAYG